MLDVCDVLYCEVRWVVGRFTSCQAPCFVLNCCAFHSMPVLMFSLQKVGCVFFLKREVFNLAAAPIEEERETSPGGAPISASRRKSYVFAGVERESHWSVVGCVLVTRYGAFLVFHVGAVS